MHFGIQFLWNIIEYFSVTGLAQEPRDLVNELPFKVSPVIPLDPIKTLYSVILCNRTCPLTFYSTLAFMETINILFKNVLHVACNH